MRLCDSRRCVVVDEWEIVIVRHATIENCEVVMMMLNKAAKTDVGTYYGYADEELP